MGSLNRQLTHYTQPPVKHVFDGTDSGPTQATERRVSLELADRFKELLPAGGGTDKVACYLARDVATGQQVRLKVLSRDLPLSQQMIELFHLEAEAASQLAHPHIARARPAEVADGLYFATSDVSAGIETLRSRLDWNAWLNQDEVARIGIQMARALDYAHGRGVLHLHLHPENILLDENGLALLTDFGVPAWLHREWSSKDWARKTGACYLSPEQLRGGEVDHRSDLYALGALLYEMLTDRVPFDSRDAEEIRQRHIKGRPLALELIVPGVASDFATGVMRLLAPDADKRFANASEFVALVQNSVIPGFEFEGVEPAASSTSTANVTSLLASESHSQVSRAIPTEIIAVEARVPSSIEAPVEIDPRATEPPALVEEAADYPGIEPDIMVAGAPAPECAVEPLPDLSTSTSQLESESELVVASSGVGLRTATEVVRVTAVALSAPGQPQAVKPEPARATQTRPRVVWNLPSRLQWQRVKVWMLLEKRVLAFPVAVVLLVSLIALPRTRATKPGAELAPAAVSTPASSGSTAASSESQPEAAAFGGDTILTPVFGRPVDSAVPQTTSAAANSVSTPTPTPAQAIPSTAPQTAGLPQVSSSGVALTSRPTGILPGPAVTRSGEPPPAPPSHVEPKPETSAPKEEAKSEAARREPGAVPTMVLGAVKARVVPRYPLVARQSGVTGTVDVRVDVDERGKVVTVRALSGPLLLRTEAEYAARAWKFEPSYLDGKPAGVTRTLSFDFKN